MQILILQKVTYEIPLQTRIYEDNIKNDINSLIMFRMNSIAKSLRTYFNLKLKFCLNKAGFDTNTLDLKPFLESDDDHFEMDLGELEVPSFNNQENRAGGLKDYMESNSIQAVANEIKNIENSIYNHKISVEPDHHGYSRNQNGNYNSINAGLHSKSNNGNCEHLPFNHHHQVKLDVVKHLQDEMKNSTNGLMKFQSNKITETFKEASHQIQLKLSQDINNILDGLEEKFKAKFEEIIDIKTSQLLDILGHPQKVSPYRKKISTSPKNLSSNSLTISALGPSSGKKDFRALSPSRISTHKMQIQNELEQIQDDINFGKINQDTNKNLPASGLKITSPFDSNAENNFITYSGEPSFQGTLNQPQSQSNTRNTQDVKQKIAFLKNSLNFLDEGEKSLSRSPRRNNSNFI